MRTIREGNMVENILADKVYISLFPLPFCVCLYRNSSFRLLITNVDSTGGKNKVWLADVKCYLSIASMSRMSLCIVWIEGERRQLIAVRFCRIFHCLGMWSDLCTH